MEGVPAPDVADYKRRKEVELGLTAGSISQPQAKRPKTENRPFSEEELRAQLEAHKALMGAHETPAPAPSDTSQSAVYAATPQTYVVPPALAPPASVPPVPVVPPGAPPAFPGIPPPPGAFPGLLPFPTQQPGMPPGYVFYKFVPSAPLVFTFLLLQASATRFPYARFPSSRYDTTFPTATWYGSSLPSAWCYTTVPSSLRDSAYDSRLDACSASIVSYTNTRIGPADSASPSNAAKSNARTDEPRTKEEDGAQVLRA